MPNPRHSSSRASRSVGRYLTSCSFTHEKEKKKKKKRSEMMDSVGRGRRGRASGGNDKADSPVWAKSRVYTPNSHLNTEPSKIFVHGTARERKTEQEK
jgi:hypothetical protein